MHFNGWALLVFHDKRLLWQRDCFVKLKGETLTVLSTVIAKSFFFVLYFLLSAYVNAVLGTLLALVQVENVQRVIAHIDCLAACAFLLMTLINESKNLNRFLWTLLPWGTIMLKNEMDHFWAGDYTESPWVKTVLSLHHKAPTVQISLSEE